MLTKLLFPPQWIPTQPYLSLPALTAFLKSNHQNVEQMDVNVTFYDDLLSKQSMKFYFERSYEKFQQLDSKNVLPPDLQKQYASLSTSMLYGEYVINEVEDAKNVLRSRDEFYDLEKLFRAFKILELGLKLASSAYFPTSLTFHSYDMRYSCRSSREILSAINNREENLFIDYFEKNIVPEILENSPGLVGISIINTSQLIPGLTLANLIKKADENIHINIGGSIFTRLIKEISQNSGLFSVFDSVIVHEGETPLSNLIRYLDGGYNIQDISNLIYKNGPEIRMNRIDPEGEDINSLPAPCFDGLPLNLYLSPELVLPVLSARGCYWKRCAFCDHSYGYSGKYRPRDVDLLYNDLSYLKSKYNTRYFTFQDEGISPNLISKLSDKMVKDSLDISWLADARFESAFSPELGTKINDAGCKMIYFGLESASDRVLAYMDKGIKKDNVLKICKSISEAGIWTHLFLIFGFPTETKEEAEETINFILQNNKLINSMSFGSFQLTKHSKVYEKPEFFAIKKKAQQSGTDLSLWYDYEITRGMSRKEIDELIQEFYNELSFLYPDFPIWSNLDREHLFLYISYYKKTKNKAADLSHLIEKIIAKKKENSNLIDPHVENDGSYPLLNEGIFTGAFNFNPARIIHDIMTGSPLENEMKKERSNVLFDTNDNRIFTISDFGRDVLERSNGRLSLSEIIEIVGEKYKLTYNEAESKSKKFLQGLMEKNSIRLLRIKATY